MATVCETARDVFEKLQQDPEGQLLLKENDQTFLFEVTDEGPFVIDIDDGRVEVKEGSIPWPPTDKADWLRNSWMKADSDTFQALFSGDIGPMAAYYRGKLRLSGLVSDVKQPVDAWMFKLMLGGIPRPISVERCKLDP